VKLRVLEPGEPQPERTEAETLALASAVIEAIMQDQDRWAEEFDRKQAEIDRRVAAGESIWAPWPWEAQS
jgi:hypothetical protein